MDYGLQISASGALTSIHAQDVLTNNLANVNTTGFKPLMTGTMFRDAARIEDHLPQMSSNSLLERLGSGVLSAPGMINFAQGPLEQSDSDFDVAIQGDGFFMVGDPGNPALTRDGRFALNSDGQLVMSTTGTPVLDDGQNPIFIEPQLGPIEIADNGVIRQNGLEVAQLGFSDVPDRSVLAPIGSNRFAGRGGMPLTLSEATGTIRQHMLEGSGASEIDSLMKIQAASRSAQGNLGMIDLQNRLITRAINTFGRIG